MTVEAVTHVLCWIASRDGGQTTQAIILTDSMSLLQKVGCIAYRGTVSMVDLYLQNLPWKHCSGHAGMKGNQRADRLAGKAAITSGLRLGRYEVLRSLRHYLRAQSQANHITDRLEERGGEVGLVR